jgi:hypothetical protein
MAKLFGRDVRVGRLGDFELEKFKASDLRQASAMFGADGAITPVGGVILLTKATAGAYTLAAPTQAQEGMMVTILSVTAAAHTVTQTSPGFNSAGAGGDVATYGAAIGNAMIIYARSGVWYTISLKGVTLA